MSTLRSTMSRSVVNCSLSEVTRRTIMFYRYEWKILQKFEWVLGVDDRWTPGCLLYFNSLSAIAVTPLYCINRTVLFLFLYMSFFVRCRDVARSSFSLLSLCWSHFRYFVYLIVLSVGLGFVRTATKRAGGTVHNHGGSPGKRLGVKKFSGEFFSHNNKHSNSYALS